MVRSKHSPHPGHSLTETLTTRRQPHDASQTPRRRDPAGSLPAGILHHIGPCGPAAQLGALLRTGQLRDRPAESGVRDDDSGDARPHRSGDGADQDPRTNRADDDGDRDPKPVEAARGSRASASGPRRRRREWFRVQRHVQRTHRAPAITRGGAANLRPDRAETARPGAARVRRTQPDPEFGVSSSRGRDAESEAHIRARADRRRWTDRLRAAAQRIA